MGNAQPETHSKSSFKQGNNIGGKIREQYQYQNNDLILKTKDLNGAWRRAFICFDLITKISPKFEEVILKKLKSNQSFMIIKPYLIYIDDIDAESLEIIISYCDGLDTEIEPSMVWILRKVAWKYQIEDLLQEIDEIVLKSVKIDNFCEVLKFYGDLNDLQSQYLCIQKLRLLPGEHSEIFSSKYFYHLKLADLRLLLQSHLLQVDDEILWLKCLQWASCQHRISKKLVLKHFAVYLDAASANKSYLNHCLHPIVEEQAEAKTPTDFIESKQSIKNLDKTFDSSIVCCSSGHSNIADQTSLFDQTYKNNLPFQAPKNDSIKDYSKNESDQHKKAYEVNGDECDTPLPAYYEKTDIMRGQPLISKSPLSTSLSTNIDVAISGLNTKQKTGRGKPIQMHSNIISKANNCDCDVPMFLHYGIIGQNKRTGKLPETKLTQNTALNKNDWPSVFPIQTDLSNKLSLIDPYQSIKCANNIDTKKGAKIYDREQDFKVTEQPFDHNDGNMNSCFFGNSSAGKDFILTELPKKTTASIMNDHESDMLLLPEYPRKSLKHIGTNIQNRPFLDEAKLPSMSKVPTPDLASMDLGLTHLPFVIKELAQLDVTQALKMNTPLIDSKQGPLLPKG